MQLWLFIIGSKKSFRTLESYRKNFELTVLAMVKYNIEYLLKLILYEW